jgi:hypothetical protein
MLFIAAMPLSARDHWRGDAKAPLSLPVFAPLMTPTMRGKTDAPAIRAHAPSSLSMLTRSHAS